jgi:hypothetical protein
MGEAGRASRGVAVSLQRVSPACGSQYWIHTVGRFLGGVDSSSLTLLFRTREEVATDGELANGGKETGLEHENGDCLEDDDREDVLGSH